MPNKLRLEKVKRKCKNDFWFFCRYLGGDFFKKREEQLKIIAKEMQYAYEKGGKIAISTPPRTAKSTIVNYFIAWTLLNDISNSIIKASYSATISKELNQMVRDIISSDKFNDLMVKPFVFTEDTQTKIRIKGHHRANIYASSVGGSTTGFGGNIIIADDLYKDHIEALSDTINKKTINWFHSALESRLDGKKQVVIMIGTRWRTGELVDVLEINDYFDKIIKIPALKNNGKSFNEEIITTENLLARKKNMHHAIFNSMYQQMPIEAFDNIIKLSQIKYIENYEANDYLFRLALFDIADGGGDRNAGAIVDIYDDEIIVVDLVRRSENFTEFKIVIKDLIYHYEPDYTLIEANSQSASIREFVTDVRKEFKNVINSFKTTQNKETKILLNIGEIKNYLFLKTNDKEYNSYIREICKYSFSQKNQHDDEIDVLAMINEKIKTIKRKIK